MAKNYTIESEEGVLVVRFSSAASYSDIRSAQTEAAAIAKVGRRLWDLSPGVQLTSEEVRRLADEGRKQFGTPSRIAIVAPHDLTFGLSRVHQAYREQPDFEAMVFRSEREAIVWLRESD